MRGGGAAQDKPHVSASETYVGPREARDWYKRPCDFTVLVVAFVLLLPVWVAFWIAIPIAIWLGDRGPAFYTQLRLGKNGELFRVVKFRTMVRDAERSIGPIWALEEDSRITGVGRVLRRFKLDEMPQVLNILKGEMSLVGPRPERPELADHFGREVPGFSMRLRVRPGVAGLAQARGRYSSRPRDKLRYDNLYIEKMSAWLDVKLLAWSVLAVLFGGGRRFW